MNSAHKWLTEMFQIGITPVVQPCKVKHYKKESWKLLGKKINHGVAHCPNWKNKSVKNFFLNSSQMLRKYTFSSNTQQNKHILRENVRYKYLVLY